MKVLIAAAAIAASISPALAGGMGGCANYSAQIEEPVTTATAEPTRSTPAPELYPSSEIPVDTAALIVPPNKPVKGM